MPQLTVPIVRTASLPAGYCYPADPNTFFQDIVARIVGMFTNNLNGVIISATEPGVNDRDKLWFNTHNSDNNLYSWVTSIGWARKHPVPADAERRVWFPLETDLSAEDGGNANPVSDADGPFWQRDTTFDGRFPLAKGTIPGTAVTVTDGATVDSAGVSGEYEHVLTLGELPAHTHQNGNFKNLLKDAYVGATTGNDTVNSDVEAPVGAGDWGPTASVGSGEGHNNMPPFLCGIWAYRTARIYILPS